VENLASTGIRSPVRPAPWRVAVPTGLSRPIIVSYFDVFQVLCTVMMVMSWSKHVAGIELYRSVYGVCICRFCRPVSWVGLLPGDFDKAVPNALLIKLGFVALTNEEKKSRGKNGIGYGPRVSSGIWRHSSKLNVLWYSGQYMYCIFSIL